MLKCGTRLVDLLLCCVVVVVTVTLHICWAENVVEEPADLQLRRVMEKVDDDIRRHIAPYVPGGSGSLPAEEEIHAMSYEIVREPNGLNYVVKLLVRGDEFEAVIHLRGPGHEPELTALYKKAEED